LNLVSILVSRPVRQALAFNAFQGARRPFPIANTKAGPIVVPKFKFFQIALQVLLAAMNVGSAHPALECAEKVFDVVRAVPVFVDVFLAAPMRNGLVTGKFLAKLGVEFAFIAD
jgi:hypothetical protein